MKIYHICTDSIFLKYVVRNFNATGTENVFCTVSKKLTSHKILKIFKTPEKLCREINEKADLVIIHSLCVIPKKLLKINKKIVWSTWGHDIYSQFEYNRMFLIDCELYKDKTKKFFYNPFVFMRNLITRLKDFIFSRYSKKYLDLFYKKVTYLSTVLDIEFELIEKNNPAYNFKKFILKYADYQKDKVKFSMADYKEHVWIGNSATPENNHLDVIDVLKTRGINCNICLPVSYGNYLYKKFLQKSFHKSENVKLIENFMPLDEYNKLCSEYGNFIFGNIRQQAMGNIYNALMTGKRVFLYKDSIIYKAFCRLGYKVFSIEDDLTLEIIKMPFEYEDAIYNYNLFWKLNDGKVLLKLLNEQLETICKD